jgi:hypothetical protein
MDASDEISPLDISACIAEKAEETLAPLKEDLVDWLNKLFDVEITVENFMECLDNGVLVSKVAELVHHAAEEYYRAGKTKNYVPKYDFRYHKKARSGTFFARDNVAFFLDWCRCFGVSESVLFESDGLVMHKEPREVVLCLLEVARLAANYGIEPPGIVSLEKEIDAEIANEEQFKGTAEEIKEEVVELKQPVKEEKVPVKQSNNNVERKLSLDKQVWTMNATQSLHYSAMMFRFQKPNISSVKVKYKCHYLFVLSDQNFHYFLVKVLQLAKAHSVKIQKVKEGRYIVEGKITIFVRVSLQVDLADLLIKSSYCGSSILTVHSYTLFCQL